MNIEMKENKLVIELSPDIDFNFLKRFLEYMRLKEISSKSQATDAQIMEISEDIKDSWFKGNELL
jgi:hypothetical protein